ncbi:hypothetical protein CAPTEDRAFT_187696 [Capitella teleta]|uniref:Uncharacterized protein n=1 Tax=Capitella teleta TaxID=283909 RepID=R7T4N1_CAPTE|nr:hypothetical protein CAPTEDRAFT_187696 [Capitella teleta]|eukprot:ELT87796.1 hypothetical protein CAPTEDRAFT_187696 [Capitella teleta]
MAFWHLANSDTTFVNTYLKHYWPQSKLFVQQSTHCIPCGNFEVEAHTERKIEYSHHPLQTTLKQPEPYSTMPRKTSLSESETHCYRRQSSPALSNRHNTHAPVQRQSTVSFPIEYNGNGIQQPLAVEHRCCKCKAVCPPTDDYHNISPNLFCYYTEHSDDTFQTRFWMESTQEKPMSKLEVLASRRPDKFLMSVCMKDPYPRGMYCLKCFQRHGCFMQKNEANNVCRYYDIRIQEPVFTVENT